MSILISPFTARTVWGQSKTSLSFMPLISKRSHFSLLNGMLLTGHNETDYTSFNIPGLQSGNCTNEIVIVVHGWGLNDNQSRGLSPVTTFYLPVMSSYSKSS